MIDNSTIKSPVQGRVQYRLVEPGAVLPPGGKIATVIDLSDVYTTVYLPAPQAGRLQVGNDPDAARLVMDAYPDYVFPASVSFVAPKSQFTPKTVEVQSEREQLYFRVKLQKPPGVLKGMEEAIKSGLRAVAYVRLDPSVEWPASARGQAAAQRRAGRQIGCRDDDRARRDGKAATEGRRRRRLAQRRHASLRQDRRAR